MTRMPTRRTFLAALGAGTLVNPVTGAWPALAQQLAKAPGKLWRVGLLHEGGAQAEVGLRVLRG